MRKCQVEDCTEPARTRFGYCSSLCLATSHRCAVAGCWAVSRGVRCAAHRHDVHLLTWDEWHEEGWRRMGWEKRGDDWYPIQPALLSPLQLLKEYVWP